MDHSLGRSYGSQSVVRVWRTRGHRLHHHVQVAHACKHSQIGSCVGQVASSTANRGPLCLPRKGPPFCPCCRCSQLAKRDHRDLPTEASCRQTQFSVNFRCLCWQKKGHRDHNDELGCPKREGWFVSTVAYLSSVQPCVSVLGCRFEEKQRRCTKL